MTEQQYITTIGLEVHLQLSTKTKAFCGCLNEFGKKPNSSVCPVCLGFPGSLPVLNKEYLRYAIKVAVALRCRIAEVMKFDRKNYFYPDLPKNYQISQYAMPLSCGGFIEIDYEGKRKKIGITRVHMEEDAGKLLHDEARPFSYIDFNRSGTPLLEIVSEPQISSADEAHLYLTTLKSILEYLNVSTCNMQEGSLRCDANISVRPAGQERLSSKVELKNMNTFKGVKQALEYEQNRQIKLLSSGKKAVQETRLWEADKKATEPMRTKEEAHDYRYFPEPDLVPFRIEGSLIDEISRSIPEMPEAKRARFIKEYGLSEYDAAVLVADKAMSDYFESCVRLYSNPKTIVNWLTGELLRYLNDNGMEFKELRIRPEGLIGMLRLIDNGTISGKIAKELLADILSSGRPADEIVKEKGLLQISDYSEIERIVDEVIAENKGVAEDYLSGKEKAITFLVGQIMKKSKGKVNPHLANEILRKRLKRERD